MAEDFIPQIFDLIYPDKRDYDLLDSVQSQRFREETHEAERLFRAFYYTGMYDVLLTISAGSEYHTPITREIFHYFADYPIEPYPLADTLREILSYDRGKAGNFKTDSYIKSVIKTTGSKNKTEKKGTIGDFLHALHEGLPLHDFDPRKMLSKCYLFPLREETYLNHFRNIFLGLACFFSLRKKASLTSPEWILLACNKGLEPDQKDRTGESADLRSHIGFMFHQDDLGRGYQLLNPTLACNFIADNKWDKETDDILLKELMRFGFAQAGDILSSLSTERHYFLYVIREPGKKFTESILKIGDFDTLGLPFAPYRPLIPETDPFSDGFGISTLRERDLYDIVLSFTYIFRHLSQPLRNVLSTEAEDKLFRGIKASKVNWK